MVRFKSWSTCFKYGPAWFKTGLTCHEFGLGWFDGCIMVASVPNSQLLTVGFTADACHEPKSARLLAFLPLIKEYRGAQFTQCQLMRSKWLQNRPTSFKTGQLYIAAWNRVDRFQNGRPVSQWVSCESVVTYYY